MSLARRAVELLALPTIALGVALVLVPDRSGLAFHVWLLVVLGLVLLALLEPRPRCLPPNAVGRSLPASVGRRSPLPARARSRTWSERSRSRAPRRSTCTSAFAPR